MLTLIKGADVFAPEHLGPKDILIGGGRVLAVAEKDGLNLSGTDLETVDARGLQAFPGLVDPHVHMLGGGGEGGPATRAPEVRIEDTAAAGVTTMIGCLGTDGITRHMSSLLAKARALEIEGVTTFIFSGSYELPVRTITGSVRSDLVLIEKVIGAGEIAVSDHRSCQPTFEEIARLAAECRVGGLLGGKAGVLHLHVGDGERRLEYLFRLIRETELPATQVIPTHVTRNPDLFAESLDWVGKGGYVDVTIGPDPDPATEPDVAFETALTAFMDKGLPLEHITASSDANGSVPVFDKAGRLLCLGAATEGHMFRKFSDIVRKGLLGPDRAVRLFSTNAAVFYGFRDKGRLAEGLDADLLLVDGDFRLTDVFARGKRMMAGGRVTARGTFGAA